MQTLEALTRDARALARGEITAPEAELARQMQICNGCRYCAGFCAVFPVMTLRLEFGKADIHYMANLCHNCGACLPACLPIRAAARFRHLLFLVSVTGLLLWLLGATAAMPLMLAVHLGALMALFLTLPYGKFANGVFRTAALLRFAIEKRQPNRLELGGE